MKELLKHKTNWLTRMIFILVSLFVLQNSILAASTSKVNLGFDPHNLISEIYVYDEIESSSWDFRHKDSGEKLRYDPGKEGKNHWQRFNPNSSGKRDLYLDRFGNPVSRGSNASHIGAGENFLLAIPGLVQDVQDQINNLQQQRDKLSIWNPDDWGGA